MIWSLLQQGLFIRESSTIITGMPDENKGQKELLDSQKDKLELVYCRAFGCTMWQQKWLFPSGSGITRRRVECFMRIRVSEDVYHDTVVFLSSWGDIVMSCTATSVIIINENDHLLSECYGPTQDLGKMWILKRMAATQTKMTETRCSIAISIQ